MKHTATLAVLFILSLCFSIAYLAPLNWIVNQANLPKQISITHPTGKIWQGYAEKITWNKWQSNDVYWDFELTPLVFNHIKGSLKANIFNGPLSMQIDVDDKTLNVNNGLYDNKISNILAQLKFDFIELAGDLSLKLKQLTINPVNHKIKNLTLKSQWINASIKAPFNLKLGQVFATSNFVDGKIISKITSNAGDIEISGVITLKQNKNFLLNLLIHPTLKLSNDIKLSLRLIGKELPNGDFLINQKGNLQYL